MFTVYTNLSEPQRFQELYRYIGMIILLSFYPHILFAIFAILNNIIRRFHDMGKSGWHLFLLFLPILHLYYLILLFLKPGSNEPAK